MKIKKFSLSLVLCLILLPGLFVFTACKRDNSYSLDNLYDDYTEIIQKHEILTLTDTNAKKAIKVEYNNFDQDNHYFATALTEEPYNKLNSFYNPLLTHSLEFVANYIEKCADDKLNVKESARDDLKSSLDEFDNALTYMYNQTLNVSDLLKTGGDLNSNVHMIRLSNLFESYENLYECCFDLSNKLTNIYFNHAISDANPNYSLQSLADFDASRVVVNFRSRIVNQIVNLTENYITQNVRGLKLYQNFTTKQKDGYPAIPESFNEYENKINSIDIEFSPSLGQYINSSDKKQRFYNASIELYNIQSNLDNIKSAYATAIKEIVYSEIVADPNATDYQKTCAKIISDHGELIKQNNIAIQNILNILMETT